MGGLPLSLSKQARDSLINHGGAGKEETHREEAVHMLHCDHGRRFMPNPHEAFLRNK